MATWLTLRFQNRASPLMEQLIFFHDHSLFILLIITVIISYILVSLGWNFYINRYLLEGQVIELIWTVIPALTLIFIALPSLRLLYLLDEVNIPSLTVKVIGHQWYWRYEYSDFTDLEFDSYIIPLNELDEGGFRLLEVDHHTVIPVSLQTRVLVSAADVLHSWAVPALGVKIDANPGRLNQTSFLLNRVGLFYGQCSEICGANHSFIPIVIEGTDLIRFINWVSKV